jgi:selenocysteine lyase/cysteine desulfurase
MRELSEILQADDQIEDLSSLSRRSFFKQSIATVMVGSWLPNIGMAKQPGQGRSPEDRAYWRWVADQFLLKPGLTYMNTGTRGPSPRSVYRAQIAAIKSANEDRLGYVKNVYTEEFKEGVRTKLATYLGCDAQELAITNNTTEGMAIGTNGPDFNRGDEIIYTNHDHSSGAQPVNLRCAREGLIPVVVDLSAAKFHPPRNPEEIVKAIDAAITPKTKLISFCHINYTDGCVLPVREICELARNKGVLSLVDGAHPPGMLDLDLHDLGCDMYAGACHKWMLAGQLTGFFYVRRDLQDRIWPSIYSGPVNGRNMYGEIDDREKFNTALRYETHGSVNYAAIQSINAALDFHNSIGVTSIEARDRYMASQARSALGNMSGVELFVSEDPRLCAGLVSFKVSGVETKALASMLWERHRIYIREVVHPEINWDANRLSLHIMVNDEQLDRTLGAIEEIAKASRA